MVGRVTGGGGILPVFRVSSTRKRQAAAAADETDGVSAAALPPPDQQIPDHADQHPQNDTSETAFHAAMAEMEQRSTRSCPSEILSLALSIATQGSGRVVSAGVAEALSPDTPSLADEKAEADHQRDWAERFYTVLKADPTAPNQVFNRRA